MMFDYSRVDKFVDLIVSEFSPKMIIVFGSVADHQANEYSDIDVLVVMDAKGNRIERRIPLIMALGRLQFDTDAIVATPEEFERKKNDENSFIYQIVNTGYVAYEA